MINVFFTSIEDTIQKSVLLKNRNKITTRIKTKNKDRNRRKINVGQIKWKYKTIKMILIKTPIHIQ